MVSVNYTVFIFFAEKELTLYLFIVALNNLLQIFPTGVVLQYFRLVPLFLRAVILQRCAVLLCFRGRFVAILHI
jgi:hypothetical protein